jgi:hypothetical protein
LSKRVFSRVLVILFALVGSAVALQACASASTCSYTVYLRQTYHWNYPWTEEYDVHTHNNGSASGCRTEVDVYYYTINNPDYAKVKKSSSNSDSYYSNPRPGISPRAATRG